MSTSVADVQKQVDEVTGVMRENIDVALQNQTKAEDLVDKTEQLSSDADQFKKQSKSLKKRMWWQDKKLLLIIIGMVVVILLLIIILCATLVPKRKNKGSG